MTSRPPRLLSAAVALVSLTSCAPRAVTDEGRAVNGLYDIFFWVAAGVFTITAGLIAWSIIRYRERPGDNDLPKQFHQNLKLEIVWFAIPQIIVIALFVLTALTLSEVNEQEAEPDATVHVTAFQWGWRFEFEGSDKVVEGTPEDRAEVLLPTGDVAFVLESADVVHNFYVPRFLMKRDIVPGRETRFDVSIEAPGTYGGVCAEFCGLLHDQMTFTLEAVAPEEFEAWLAE
ncbi:MAG: cytochrome c oxidase subunit II [Actinomycetota bacterium]